MHTEEPKRIRMRDERKSVTHKFTFYNCISQIVETSDGPKKKMVDLDGYITVGLYPDGTPGEIFLTIGKQGGMFAVYDCLMVSISIGLQSGIPLETFVEKFKHLQFDPYGVTNNPQIPMAKSIPDYVMRWLELRFLKKEEDDGISQPGKEGQERKE